MVLNELDPVARKFASEDGRGSAVEPEVSPSLSSIEAGRHIQPHTGERLWPQCAVMANRGRVFQPRDETKNVDAGS